jgi:TonB family protein
MRGIQGPASETSPDLRLLVAPEPWFQVFTQNLQDLFQKSEKIQVPTTLNPGTFWSDVFVEPQLPWRRFFQSGAGHVFAIIVIWVGSRFLALQPRVTVKPTFTNDELVYTPTEYLPPLDTRRANKVHAQKADPEISEQPIISAPREADNRAQTIVTPPSVRLRREVDLPNTVAWSDQPRMPIAPAPLIPASQISRLAPQMEQSVVAPPPTVQDSARNLSLHAPQQAVVAPPPEIDADAHGRIGDLNIGHSTVIAPAPQLSVDAQRTASSGRLAARQGRSPQVIAPPPAVGGGSRAGRDVVALSLHPAVGAPPAEVAGNRRGTFAATPTGRHGASGTPDGSTGSANNGGASGGKTANRLPSGLYVGKSSNPAVNPNLIANARTPASRAIQPENEIKLSEAERAVFGGRKIYSLSLNMPNLNSGGGSWIIRFAALKQDAVSTSSNDPASDLSSPVATRKVDPAYPLEIMRQNVGGTVILYGVIHSDGTVGNVRVLRSVDDRLDRFASDAISKWQFQPAMKDGTAVDVEATFWIPFHPVRPRTGF